MIRSLEAPTIEAMGMGRKRKEAGRQRASFTYGQMISIIRDMFTKNKRAAAGIFQPPIQRRYRERIKSRPRGRQSFSGTLSVMQSSTSGLHYVLASRDGSVGR